MTKFHVGQYVRYHSDYTTKVLVNTPDKNGYIVVESYDGNYCPVQENECRPLSEKEQTVVDLVNRCRNLGYSETGLIQELIKVIDK